MSTHFIHLIKCFEIIDIAYNIIKICVFVEDS